MGACWEGRNPLRILSSGEKDAMSDLRGVRRPPGGPVELHTGPLSPGEVFRGYIVGLRISSEEWSTACKVPGGP